MTTTYNKFEDVPYSVWASGGDVKIMQKDTVPAPLMSGQAIGIVPEGNMINSNYTPGDAVPMFWWGWYVIGAILTGVVFAAIYRITIYDTFVILRSAPEGVTQDLPNGDKIYTAPDGSTWKWDHLTGAMVQIGGPTSIDVVTITKWVAVIVVLILIGYVLVKGKITVPKIDFGGRKEKTLPEAG
jgi:hypothetical protein